MTSSFNNVFGGSPVSPADVAYAAYIISANLTLYWPQFAAGNSTVAARWMNIVATAPNLNVYMPDATLAGNGYDNIIYNAGANAINIVSLNGNSIATVAPGQAWYILLKSNITQDGTWQTVQFGAGTSTANAASLAGNGLLAAAGVLNVNSPAQLVSSNFTLPATARGSLYVWTGGVGMITLPAAATVGNGFVFAVANNGSGSLTLSSSSTIDGASSSVYALSQSSFVISDGTNWRTLGKGIQNNFAVTLLNLNVAGNSNITLTSPQAQNIIQQYTGTLTGNISVIVPNTVQIYYVYNGTNGSYSLTVTTATGTGITVPQNSHVLLYCDGTNIQSAFTATIGTSLALVPGAAASPSLTFQGSTTTGLFSAATNTFSATANGTEVQRWASPATAINYWSMQSSASGNPLMLSAAGGDANVTMEFSPKGTGGLYFNGNVGIGGLPSTTVGLGVVGTTQLIGNLGVGIAPSNTYAMSVSQASSTQALFASTGANSSNVVINAPTNYGSFTNYQVNSVPLWTSGANTGTPNYVIIDKVNNVNFMSATAGSNLVLGPAQNVYLSPNGNMGIGIPLPNSALAVNGSIAVTSGLSVGGNASVGGNLSFSSGTHGIVGTVYGDNPTTGLVGESVINTFVNSNAPAATQWGDMTSISLSAGDWDVSYVLYCTANGSSVVTAQMGISPTSGNSNVGLILGDNQLAVVPPNSTYDTGATIASYRVNISAPAIYYAKANFNYSVAITKLYGRISARRVR